MAKFVKLITSMVAVAGVAAACGGGGSTAAPSSSVVPTTTATTADPGYNDPTQLAQAIEAKAPGVTVACIHAAGTQFTCHGQSTRDGSQLTVTATVAPDGNSYITSGASR